MIKRTVLKRYWFSGFFVFLWLTVPVFGQSRAELEKKRERIRNEIHRLSRQVKALKKNEENVLAAWQLQKRQIELRQKLIRQIRQEISMVNRQIKYKQDSLRDLRDELETLKNEYADAVRKAYKFSSGEKVLYFILSAESFTQAWRRVRYIKEYTAYIRKRAEAIKSKEAEIEKAVEKLQAVKNEKQNLLTRMRDEQRALEAEKRKQEQLLASLRRDKKKYIARIKQRQREANRINKQIEKLIVAEIAKANRNKGKRERNVFVLTPEGKKLAAAFSANQGRLPWPVRHGYIARHFGKHRHPVYKNLTVINYGIYIHTPENEPVKAVFDGEVLMVQIIPGANESVMIRHGNYITIYRNVKNVTVKEGQKVKAGQVIATVAKDPANGVSTLKFYIYKNRTKLNPELWLSRK